MRNRRLLRTIAATLAFDVAEWALWVGILVYAYERGGTTTAGFSSLGLLLTSALAAPVAGVLADGPRPERVLLIGYSAEAVLLVGTSVAAFANAPVVVVIVFTAGGLAAVTFARPATAVVVPSLVSTPGELTAANLLGGWCDSLSVFLGPLAAAALLEFDQPRAVFAFCGGLSLIAAWAALPLARRPPSLVEPEIDEWRHVRRALPQLLDCMRALATNRASLLLLIVLAGQYLLVGALDLIYVVLAVDILGLGSSGTGYLSASFGAGALLGGVLATLLVGRRRLAPVMLACLLMIAVSMVLLGAMTTVVTAFVLIPVAGVSRALLDITGRMLMQRVAPQDTLASVFAALEALSCLAMAGGAVLTQMLVVHGSEHSALLGIGLVFAALLAIAAASTLRSIDLAADAPVVAIRHLRRIPLFSPLTGPTLEALGRAAVPVAVGAGDTIIREGDLGDRYYAIVRGSFDVITAREGNVRTMGEGQGFGEIALVAAQPRTATVVAATDGTLLALERDTFLTAITGHAGASRMAWKTVGAYRPDLADGEPA